MKFRPAKPLPAVLTPCLAYLLLGLLLGGCLGPEEPPKLFTDEEAEAFEERIEAWEAASEEDLLGNLPGHVDYVRAEIRARQAAFAAEPPTLPSAASVQRKLAHMVDVDQFMRTELGRALGAGSGRELEGDDKTAMDEALALWREVDARHTAELQELLDRHGWFTISTFGAEADRDAWLIVQHADQDPGFQREVLVVLEGLWREGETSPSNFAYLYDRVAVAEGRPQRYGTQGRCVGSGRWEPFTIEDASRIDQLRESVGLQSLATYVAIVSKMCP